MSAAQVADTNVRPINGGAITTDAMLAHEMIENDREALKQELLEEIEQEEADLDEERGKFFRAGSDVIKLAKQIIDTYHAHLKEAKITYLFREGDWVVSGRRKPGTAKVINAEAKCLLKCDFIISISEELFEESNDKQKEAIMDHLLCHCHYRENDKSGVKVWKLRNPDVIEFSDVIGRRGVWSDGLKNMKKACAQMNLFGTDDTEES